MADALARRKEAGEKSPVGDLTAVEWFKYLEKYAEADAKVKAATNGRKELRAQIEGKLGDPDLIVAFDRARKDRDLSGEYRSKIDAAYFVIMGWERKAPNFQGGLALPLTQADAARVDLEGLEAGKSKHNRDENPYTPGQEEFARWDTSWLRGQAAIGASLTDDPAKKASTLAVVEGGKSAEQPKRRGRPPGSGKKAGQASAGGEGEPGGDAGEQAPPQDDPEEQQTPPQGDPPTREHDVEGSDGGPLPDKDKYGEEWPSSGGNGNLH